MGLIAGVGSQAPHVPSATDARPVPPPFTRAPPRREPREGRRRGMTLSTGRQIEELNELIQFDYGAVGAYDAAIAAIDAQVLRDALADHRSEHERHILELAGMVRRLGGRPPSQNAL